MPKTDDIRPMGISVADDGHVMVRYLNSDGQRVDMDLTAEINRIAAENVAKHQLDYHGG